MSPRVRPAADARRSARERRWLLLGLVVVALLLTLAGSGALDHALGGALLHQLIVVALFAAFATAAWLALAAIQRRRAESEEQQAAQAEHQALEAERLALALQGADLAMWDSHLPSGQATINDRWTSMLGYAREEIRLEHGGWEALIHPEDWARVSAAYQAHLDGLTPAYEAEYRLRHKDGHWVWVLDRGRVVQRDAQGQPVRMVGTHLDVTARVLALQEREAQLRHVADALPGPVARLDAELRYVFASAAYRAWFGLDPAALVGRHRGEVLQGRTTDLFDAHVARALAGEPQHFEARVPTVDGDRDALVDILPDRDSDFDDTQRGGQQGREGPRDPAQGVRGVFIVITDISERKRVERELRDTESRLRMSSRLARLGDWRFEVSTGQFRLSMNFAAQTDLDGNEFMTLDGMLARISEEHRARFRLCLETALRDGQTFREEIDALASPGCVRRVLVMGEAVLNRAGRVVALQGAMQDVTAARREQQQLRLLQAAVAGLNDMVLITEAQPQDEPGPRIVFVNQAIERIAGWKPEEVLGRSPRFLVGPDTDPVELDRVETALRRLQPVRTELINHTRDGQPYWVEIALAPLLDATGEATHIVSVHRDASERRRAAAAALDAKDELAATLAAVPDLLFDVDEHGTINSYHSPRSDLLSMPPAHFLGRRVVDVLPPDAAQVVHAALAEAQLKGYSGGMQYQLPLPQGEVWFELSVAPRPVSPGSPQRFIAMARDVTERRQAEADRRVLERQLREAQKIESIGTLAGGIAHDFNNILAAILGNVSLAREDLPMAHPAQDSLSQIQKASLRARSLVQQILAFSRRQLDPLAVQALRPIVDETLALLRSTLPASVKLEAQLSDEPLWLETDVTQIQQVLMNLCTNAWHALPEGRGRIEIGCEALPAGTPGLLQEPGLADVPVVHLWVQDDGEGMDAATRERIFDPFFTTKPVGQGTGLGLSVVHGIVRGHRGAVQVDSAPGAGCTFHLYFPMAAPPGGEGGAKPVPDTAAVCGLGQQVLYVDDDEVMLLMVERLLERLGYGITVCQTVPRALDLLRDTAQTFDLVISDYNMPEASGLELAAQLAVLRPGLPLIISSGYVTEELQDQALAAGVRALLNKERTLEELPSLVQRVLQGQSQSQGQS